MCNVFANRGAIHFQRGDYERAVADYTEVTKLRPHDHPYWEMLARALGCLGRYDEALRAFQTLHQLGHECADCSFMTWIAYRELGRAREGANALYRSLELNPDNAEAWYQRGVLSGSSWYTPDESEWFDGRHEQALEAFDKALALKPNFAMGWFYKGYVLYKLSHSRMAHERAIAARGTAPDFIHESLICLDRAIALDPDDPRARELKEEALAWKQENESNGR
jgi:tetratricopeptide (TPR) repeat protein